MRFILAAVAFVASVICLVIGGVQFAQAQGVNEVTATGNSASDAPLTIIHADTLAANAGAQTIEISGEGDIVAVVGRTHDIEAWVGDTQHQIVTVDAESSDVPHEQSLVFTEAGTEPEAPTPLGNDLWFEEHTGEGTLTLDLVVSPGYSLLIASDGTAPAPAEISISWPFGGYAPAVGPLLTAGAILLVLALLLLAWAILHRRRAKTAAPVSAGASAEDAQSKLGADASVADSWSPVMWRDDDAAEVVSGAHAVEELTDDAMPGETLVAVETEEPALPDPADSSIESPFAQQTEPEPESEPAAVSEPTAESALAPEPNRAPEPDLESEPEPESAPELQPESESEPMAASAPTPVAEPQPETMPASGSELEPDLEPAQEQEPEPASASEPAPAPEPTDESDVDDSKWRRPRGRNRTNAPKRAFFAAPVMALTILTLAGCAPQYWPAAWTDTTIAPTGTPTSTVEAALIEEGAEPPTLNESQLADILEDAAAVAGEGDAALDANVLESRFTGDALTERTAQYEAQEADDSLASPRPFPTGDVMYAVPEASESWPRTTFAVVAPGPDAPEGTSPSAIMLVQENARANFKVSSMVPLAANVTLPEAAPMSVGAPDLDGLELVMAPDQLAAAYADVIANGEESEFAAAFDPANDVFRQQVNDEYRAALEDELDPEVVTITFDYAATDTVPVGVGALEGGAIVAVSINETERLEAANDRALITVGGLTAALSGVETSEFGFERTYTDQLLFFVPSADSGAAVQYLGVSQAMTSAEELAEE